jgi:hypothetical protein
VIFVEMEREDFIELVMRGIGEKVGMNADEFLDLKYNQKRRIVERIYGRSRE